MQVVMAVGPDLVMALCYGCLHTVANQVQFLEVYKPVFAGDKTCGCCGKEERQ